jgi:CDP-diacylglycerol---glycerol-3-phosphate 3-phosphatidyltransferase
MTSVYDLKPRFQALLRPATGALAARGVTANQVTLAAAALSVATGLALLVAPDYPTLYLLGPLVLFVRMALNAIDGMLAREHGQKSALGGLLNELGDVVSDAALYLPLAAHFAVEPAVVVAVVLLAAWSELTGVAAVAVGASRRYDGPMGKSDRAFVFGALTLLLGVGVPAGAWLTWALGAVAGLLLVTIANRTRAAVREATAAQR